MRPEHAWDGLSLALEIENRSGPRSWTLCLALLICTVAQAVSQLLDEFMAASDRGQCIESVTFRLIEQHGPGRAEEIVHTALIVAAQRRSQQLALGCAGDISVQAILAGADPERVLKATAAGL